MRVKVYPLEPLVLYPLESESHKVGRALELVIGGKPAILHKLIKTREP